MKNKYTPWSFSKINTFKDCPRKFKYSYIDKIPAPWQDSLPTDRGKLIHLIFEHNRDIKEIRKQKEFKEIIKRKLLDKETIKTCFKVYDDFVDSKDGKSLMNSKRLYAELPLGLNHDLEIMPYNRQESNQDLFLRGYIDDVRVHKDLLFLIDWKSGKYKSKENQDWSQLLYYALGMFSETDVEKIILIFAYVDHNMLNTKVIHRKNLERYKTALYSVTDKIENTQVFDKNENPLCLYCPYKIICDEDLDISEEDLPF